MSHYEVNFTGTKQDKELRALKEIVTYLGKARFNKIVMSHSKALQGASSREAYRAVKIALALAGVQGYWPVRAYFKHLWPLV